MKKTLVIADNDEMFVENLEEYLLRNYSSEFEIRTYTDRVYLEKFFSTPQKVDVLILNKDLEFEGINQQYINNILLISDEEDNEGLEHDYIFRYGDIESIYNKINLSSGGSSKSSYSQSKNELKKTKVISIYSPVGGVGKTTISVAISVDLASHLNKVLYLNLENMPTTRSYFKRNKNSRNLSDVISYIGAGKESLINSIKSCINMDEDTRVYYINPADNIFDLEGMTQDDIKYLIQTIVEMKDFTHLIIDTSSTYNTFKKSIIDVSDRLITPIEQNSISKEKVLNFLKYIDEEELYKFIPVINKYRPELEDCVREISNVNPSFQIQGSIDFYSPLKDSNSYISIFSRNNEFTASIKGLGM